MSAPRSRPRIVYGLVTEEADAIRGDGRRTSPRRFVGLWIEAGDVLRDEGFEAAKKHVETVDALFGVEGSLEDEDA